MMPAGIDHAFNQLDIVLALVVVIASVRGAVRGFVSEALAMSAVILAVAAAVLFSSDLTGALTGLIGGSIWNQVIAFLLIFIVVYLVVKLVEGLLHSGVERLSLHKLDRVLGLLLGAAEGVIVVLLVLLVLSIQPFVDVTDLLAGSVVAESLLPLLVPARDYLDEMREGAAVEALLAPAAPAGGGAQAGRVLARLPLGSGSRTGSSSHDVLHNPGRARSAGDGGGVNE